MFENLQLAAIGFAVVIDAVLLIALLERANRRRISAWIVIMSGATLAFHVGSFAHHLIEGATTKWALAVDRVAMSVMVLGLMTLPAATVHGCVRMLISGNAPNPRRDSRFLACYLPMLGCFSILGSIDPSRTRDFMALVEPFRKPYLIYFLSASLLTSVGYFVLRKRDDFRAYRSFLMLLSVTLLATSCLVTLGAWLGIDAWPQATRAITLGVTLAPVVTVMLFLYYVLRFGLLQLLVERTLVYGAIVVGFLLFHNLVFKGIRNTLSDQFRVDFGLVEGIAAVCLILLYTPFRQRVSESLRYLTGARVDKVRTRTRRLSSQMTGMIGQPLDEVLNHVASEIGEIFRLDDVRIQLIEPRRLSVPNTFSDDATNTTHELFDCLSGEEDHYVATWRADDRTTQFLDELNASVAVLLEHGQVKGVMLTGRQPANQRLGDEDLNSLVLLGEQLAITIQIDRLQSERLNTERRVLQQEKLSTLGLLAGSIAHEVRNPLSSIKAITTVLAEDLGADSEHAEDLQLVLGEIDRLSATTSQLLAFARSEPGAKRLASPVDVLNQTLQLMRHLAGRNNVEITTDIDESDQLVSSDTTSLREVYFNLLTNSLDAAGSGGRISVSCQSEHGHIVTKVSDDGPGIAPEIRDRLFEPFATTKVDGTGLGLYIVGRHVKEIGGEIHCDSASGSGTTFTLRLPIAAETQS